MEKIKLSQKEKKSLRLLVLFYDKSKKGCKFIGVIADRQTLNVLEKMELIFKTKYGYFPSTKGQNYVKFN